MKFERLEDKIQYIYCIYFNAASSGRNLMSEFSVVHCFSPKFPLIYSDFFMCGSVARNGLFLMNWLFQGQSQWGGQGGGVPPRRPFVGKC